MMKNKKDLENSRNKYMDRAIAAEEKVKRLTLALTEIRSMVNSGSEEMHIIDEAIGVNSWADETLRLWLEGGRGA